MYLHIICIYRERGEREGEREGERGERERGGGREGERGEERERGGEERERGRERGGRRERGYREGGSSGGSILILYYILSLILRFCYNFAIRNHKYPCIFNPVYDYMVRYSQHQYIAAI